MQSIKAIFSGSVKQTNSKDKSFIQNQIEDLFKKDEKGIALLLLIEGYNAQHLKKVDTLESKELDSIYKNFKLENMTEKDIKFFVSIKGSTLNWLKGTFIPSHFKTLMTKNHINIFKALLQKFNPNNELVKFYNEALGWETDRQYEYKFNPDRQYEYELNLFTYKNSTNIMRDIKSLKFDFTFDEKYNKVYDQIIKLDSDEQNKITLIKSLLTYLWGFIEIKKNSSELFYLQRSFCVEQQNVLTKILAIIKTNKKRLTSENYYQDQVAKIVDTAVFYNSSGDLAFDYIDELMLEIPKQYFIENVIPSFVSPFNMAHSLTYYIDNMLKNVSAVSENPSNSQQIGGKITDTSDDLVNINLIEIKKSYMDELCKLKCADEYGFDVRHEDYSIVTKILYNDSDNVREYIKTISDKFPNKIA